MEYYVGLCGRGTVTAVVIESAAHKCDIFAHLFDLL